MDMDVADERRERLSAERRRVSGEGASSSSLWQILVFHLKWREKTEGKREVGAWPDGDCQRER